MFDAAFLPTILQVVEKLCARNYCTLTKIRSRNEAKIYKETEFLSSEGHHFNFTWLLPNFSLVQVNSSLDVVRLDLPLEAFTAFS